MTMPERSDLLTSARRVRNGLVGMFLKGVLGLAAVFAIAAVLAPWLFDQRDTLKTVLAFGLWLACPLIAFLVGFELWADWKRMRARRHLL
jgi:uncharacterized membrane protein (GlpM family)